jgi:urease subunit gamma/beta
MAWDDLTLAEVTARARRAVTAEALHEGVADLVPSLQVEALFPHGTVLVHVDAPFGPATAGGPGAVRAHPGAVALAPDRERRQVRILNTGPLAIWVSSHVPLGRLNPALRVSLAPADSYRLDLPAGTAVKIPPGDERELPAVAIGGDR